MAAILVAMSAKGFSVSEMTGCAQTLLKKKKDIPVDSRGLAEIVGTGGDGKGSFNISSTVECPARTFSRLSCNKEWISEL